MGCKHDVDALEEAGHCTGDGLCGTLCGAEMRGNSREVATAPVQMASLGCWIAFAKTHRWIPRLYLHQQAWGKCERTVYGKLLSATPVTALLTQGGMFHFITEIHNKVMF